MIFVMRPSTHCIKFSVSQTATIPVVAGPGLTTPAGFQLPGIQISLHYSLCRVVSGPYTLQ